MHDYSSSQLINKSIFFSIANSFNQCHCMSFWRSIMQLCTGQIRTKENIVHNKFAIDRIMGNNGHGKFSGQRTNVYSIARS